MKQVVVTGAFDVPGSRQIRFLEDASKLGDLHVLLWSDEVVERLEGAPPKFPAAERLYLMSAIRYPSDVRLVESLAGRDDLPFVDVIRPDLWATSPAGDTPGKRAVARGLGIEYRVLDDQRVFESPAFDPELVRKRLLAEPPWVVGGEYFGIPKPRELVGGRIRETGLKGGGGRWKVITRDREPRVIVTGCFDWLHSGHVRFFEEAAALGDLYVVVGHDANIKLLKGQGHPLFPQNERRYAVGAIRSVKQALISSGHGWMDAEPEIDLILPDIYFVNEDGDKPEKRAFCEAHRIRFVVSKRIPKQGLPERNSTDLRGF